MRKCIHGKVKPCWICKHDYDRAAPYVATNWQQEAEEWKAECHRVSGELEADKSKMIDRSYADDLLAENIRLEAENARLRDAQLRLSAFEAAGVDNWIETAREYANNADFFRSLVVKCGVAIGAESYIQDDGGISKDVLCIKVPTLVEKLIAENARLRDALDWLTGDE